MRGSWVSYYNLLNGLFSVGGAVLIGAPLAEHAPSVIGLGPVHIKLISSLPVVFFISAVARALAAWAMLPQFREVRTVEPISTMRILWRLGVGQPIFAQTGEFIPLMRKIYAAGGKK